MNSLQLDARYGWPPGEPGLDGLCAAVRPRLVRHLESITRDPGAAEEISQEVLLRLTREIRAGRTPVNPTAWLFRVGFNLAMSRGRRFQVAMRHSHELIGSASASLEDRAIARERFAKMLDVFGELEADDRRILALAASGHGGGEIARTIGLSHGAVRSRLHRLRARLRARLAELEAA